MSRAVTEAGATGLRPRSTRAERVARGVPRGRRLVTVGQRRSLLITLPGRSQVVDVVLGWAQRRHRRIPECTSRDCGHFDALSYGRKLVTANGLVRSPRLPGGHWLVR